MINRPIRNLLISLVCLVGYSCLASATSSADNYWEDKATEIKYYKGKTITALAVLGDSLYVAYKADATPPKYYKVSLSIYRLPTGSSTDVTDKIATAGLHTITGIHIDNTMNQLWLETNNGTNCYTPELSVVKTTDNTNEAANSKPQGQCFEQRISAFYQYHNFEGFDSIMAFDFDDGQAIVELFKEGIYIYSSKDNKRPGLVAWVMRVFC